MASEEFEKKRTSERKKGKVVGRKLSGISGGNAYEFVQPDVLYIIEIKDLAKAQGISNAYGLWKQVGGSKETAYDIWNSRTTSISLNMIGRLCAVLCCKPGRLFREVE